jgi:hypothetical protein
MDRSARPAWLLFFLLPLLPACTSGGPGDTAIPLPDGGVPEGGVEVILDGGGTPATPPNGAAACPSGQCNYQTGAGCPASAPACIPALNGAAVSPACEPAGTGTTGVACTQVTDCAAGYFCSADAQCHKLCCDGDWSGCDSPSEHCIQHLSYATSSGGTVDTHAMLCYPVNTCDALTPASCTTAGTTCQIADATGATACLPEGAGGTGDPCPCKGGFTCLQPAPDGRASGPGTCHRLCGAVQGGAPPYCQEGEGICVHYVNDPPGVGECVTSP